jgi:transcriptional regulator with XRE-family HTH domain
MSTTEHIRAAFDASGLTQAQLAARAEKSERAVWAVLHGYDVKASTRDAVCLALGLQQIPVSPASFARSREVSL